MMNVVETLRATSLPNTGQLRSYHAEKISNYKFPIRFYFLPLQVKTIYTYIVMSIQEQESVKTTYYSEAMRYMDNAREDLKKANKEDNYYRDSKYVKRACGTAYNGVLIALDGFLIIKGYEKPKGKLRKSIEYYQSNISKVDKKMLDYLNSAYMILHLSGYYDGINDARVVKVGFDEAYKIIDKIKPAALSPE
ncbi:MAG: DUF5618 family protein [Tannerella sp.]|jgi:prefoldin subunit 5|nr:DUF5618 family protein [Tannerella sp.]